MEEAVWSLTDLHSEHHNDPSIGLEPSELVLHLQSREKLPRESILPNNLEIFPQKFQFPVWIWMSSKEKKRVFLKGDQLVCT